jgi:SAM-dependent methyltransferase
VAARKDILPVSLPGLRALRWTSDELYVGMKETYTVTRVEAGRAAFFTRGKLWSSAPGSLVLDPFCGSGTTLGAAARAGRDAVGLDKGELAIATTRARLAREGIRPAPLRPRRR